MEIDVRQSDVTKLDTIRVSDLEDELIAEVIYNSADGVVFRDTEMGSGLKIVDEQHAKYLMLGLRKAIELGWFK